MATLREVLTENQRRDADIIRTPSIWSYGCLPLKRERAGSFDLAFVMMGLHEGRIRLYRGSMFDAKSDKLEHFPYEDFETAEEIVYNGWKVD